MWNGNACPSFNSLQSAYHPGHSTETALLLTLNSIYTSADSGHATLLVSLDLSAAFDTIDHDILISRLQHSFGISGPVLSLLKSYLHNRSQSVRVGSVSSNSFTLTTGVPQGSCFRSCTIFSLHFTYQLPHCYSQIYSTSSTLMTLNCTSLYFPQIIRLQSPGSNSVSLIFTVGFHTTASAWILQNRMLFCLVLSKGSTHFHTLHPSISRALLYICLIQSLH